MLATLFLGLTLTLGVGAASASPITAGSPVTYVFGASVDAVPDLNASSTTASFPFSTFVQDDPACAPKGYVTMIVSQPARTSYQSGTISFTTSNGVPIPGAANLPIGSDGRVSLASVDVATHPITSLAVVRLTGSSVTTAQVTLVWSGSYATTCSGKGQQASYDPSGSKGLAYTGSSSSLKFYLALILGALGISVLMVERVLHRRW